MPSCWRRAWRLFALAVEKFAQVWDCIPDAETALSAEEKSHALVTWLQALVNQPATQQSADLGVPPEDIASERGGTEREAPYEQCAVPA